MLFHSKTEVQAQINVAYDQSVEKEINNNLCWLKENKRTKRMNPFGDNVGFIQFF